MKRSTDQVMQGILNYVDSDVMTKLPTSSKWILGTMVSLASGKASNIIESLKENPMVNALEIVDENGYIDVDMLLDAMKNSVSHYGDISLDVPLVGKMTFNSYDLERLKNFMV